MSHSTACPCGRVFEQISGSGRPRKFCLVCSPKVATTPTPHVDAVCVYCGERFSARAGVKYCRDLCRHRAKHERDKRVPCSLCGKPTGWKVGRVESATHNACLRNPDLHTHGTTANYSRGCRCIECKGAKSTAMREYVARRRAEGRPIRQFGSSGPWISPKVRLFIYERDNWTCQTCGVVMTLEGDPNGNDYPSLDHILPQSKGGTHEVDNLRLLCRWCNCVRGNGDHHADLFEEA